MANSPVVFERGIPDALILERHYLVPKPRQLQKATAAWLGLSFATAYAVLPFGAEALGLFPGLLEGFWPGGMAYGVIAGLSVLAIGRFKPKVLIPRGSGDLPADPFVMATLGSLGTWAVLHSLLPALMPFTEMGLSAFITLLGINLIESSMIGLMLGSFTRSRTKAFALAAAFQATLTALFVLFM